MIELGDRFFAGGGDLRIGGPYTWHITDMDQRRHFAVTYAPPIRPANVPDDRFGEICHNQLQRHIDELGDGVYGIRFTEPDGPVTIVTDPKQDVTLCVNNYPLSTLELPFPVQTVHLTSLTELDRIQPEVDLVSYQASPHVGNTNGLSKTIAVFKYWFIHNSLDQVWHELSSWCRLPRDHPHIVPFDAVVLDSISERIVGFTSRFIPGGTLADNNATTRPFRLRWLHQLLSVVDDLNYRYGMMHQDIAPRNLVIDEDDNLRIFDFDFSAMIDKHYNPHRDDWKGVAFTLYEIITLDDSLRGIPHQEQDAEAMLQMKWVKHADVKLDSDVQKFRDVLDGWLQERKSKKFEFADTWVRWSSRPDPPLIQKPVYGPDGEKTGTKMSRVPFVPRKDLIKWGEPFWDWKRPASHLLSDASTEGVDQRAMGDNRDAHEKATDKKVVDDKGTGQDDVDQKAMSDNRYASEEVTKKKVVDDKATGQDGVDQDKFNKEVIDGGKDKEVAHKNVVDKKVMGQDSVDQEKFKGEVVDAGKDKEVADKKAVDNKGVDQEVVGTEDTSFRKS
ncbi:hypothetical protein E4U55_006472 [Claviceps digitariae]|nr:hypothetical protein E4U55_006472 [Claviceps digitariae]